MIILHSRSANETEQQQSNLTVRYRPAVQRVAPTSAKMTSFVQNLFRNSLDKMGRHDSFNDLSMGAHADGAPPRCFETFSSLRNGLVAHGCL